MDGILLVDKPSGPSSFDIVRLVRRVGNTRKVGHTGTLDPLASGLLIVALGHGTKLVPYLMDTPKRYIAKIALGASTDTDDRLGSVIETAPVPNLSEESIRNIFGQFEGTISQVPPRFSALKSGGEPLYRKARRGEIVKPQARNIWIESLCLTDFSKDSFVLDITCGKGTYIRSLARDMARALGTTGHLLELRRLETSGFKVDDALCLEEVEEAGKRALFKEHLIPLGEALPKMPKIRLSAEEQASVSHGHAIDGASFSQGSSENQNAVVCLIGAEGELAAIARVENDRIQPVRVFL